MKNMYLSKILLFTIVLTACEGSKILSIRNNSEDNARVITWPDKESHLAKPAHDSLIIDLPPDSSLVVSANFGPILFAGKIRSQDLHINYLSIETKRDTIKAHNKREILDLIYSSKNRKHTTGSKNLRTFLVRA